MIPAATAVLLAAVLLLPGPAFSGFYTYEDENGHTYYVDSVEKIPSRYRSNTKAHQARHERDLFVSEPVSPPDRDSVRDLERLREIQRELIDSRRKRARSRRGSEVGAVMANNQVIVPVVLTYGGKTVNGRMLLDTGANGTLLHDDFAERLGLSVRGGYQAATAGGGRIHVSAARVDEISVGSRSLSDYPVMVVEYQGAGPGFDGLLGMSFLRHFPHTVDYRKGTITWND